MLSCGSSLRQTTVPSLGLSGVLLARPELDHAVAGESAFAPLSAGTVQPSRALVRSKLTTLKPVDGVGRQRVEARALALAPGDVAGRVDREDRVAVDRAALRGRVDAARVAGGVSVQMPCRRRSGGADEPLPRRTT